MFDKLGNRAMQMGFGQEVRNAQEDGVMKMQVLFWCSLPYEADFLRKTGR